MHNTQVSTNYVQWFKILMSMVECMDFKFNQQMYLINTGVPEWVHQCHENDIYIKIPSHMGHMLMIIWVLSNVELANNQIKTHIQTQIFSNQYQQR